MFRTLEAAEKAAIDGEGGEEFDTQKCNDLQEEFFSSSPTRRRDRTPELEHRDQQRPPVLNTGGNELNSLSTYFKPQSSAQLATASPVQIKPPPHPELEPLLPSQKEIVAPRDPTAEDAIFSRPSAPPTSIIRRNPKGQLRRFDSQGRELPLAAELRRAMEVENDFTQRSSMSLTQENSASAYENISMDRFATFQPSSVPKEVYSAKPKPATEAETEPLRTDSTPYTYNENDTGHIAVHFDIGDTNQTSDSQTVLSQERASQDGDATQTNIHRSELEPSSSQPQFREPQTPAPPVNPFANRGSLMNGAELFGATQPSAVGPRFAGSPTSSRPSPDAYNNFETPAPYRTISSPMVRTNDTPVQSLREIPKSSGIKSYSFDPPVLKSRSGLFEPRRYNSMQVSQEKRQASSSADLSSDDSDIEPEPRQLRKQELKVIKKQLSAVEFRPPSSSGAVEVPSTSSKRRRSGAEVYVGQCDSSDAPGTPKDDVIADSQSLLVDITGKSSPPESPNTQLCRGREQAAAEDPIASLTPSLPDSDHEYALDFPMAITQSPTAQALVSHGHQSLNVDPLQSQSSLTSQELSSNQKLPAPPSKVKDYDDDDAVPETSPAPQPYLRPMGDIGLSFGTDEDDGDELNNLPGFSQDLGFEAIMNLRTASPNHSTRRSRREAKDLSFKVPQKASSLIPESSDIERHTTAPGAGKEKVVSMLEQEPTQEFEKPITAHDVEEAPDCTDVKPTDTNAINAIHSPSSSLVDSTTTHTPAEAPAQELLADSASKPAHAAAEESQSLFVTQLEPSNGMAMDVHDTGADEISEPPVPQLAEPQSDLTNGTHERGVETGEAIRRAPQTPPAVPPTIENKEPQTNASAIAAPPLGALASADEEHIVLQSTASSLSSAPASTLATPQPEQILSLQGRKTARGRSVKPKVVKKPTNDVALRQVTPVPRHNKRKAAIIKDSGESNRPSKRQSLRAMREDSIDSLLLPSSVKGTRLASRLFTGMALTLSYMKRDSRKGHETHHEKERDQMTKIINENGGQVLEDGFEDLFEGGPQPGQVDIPATAVAMSKRSLSFVAVIANIHSSKPKYMQALALGLPCLSPHWILSCVAKDTIVDWKPYLLCAGESPLLGINFMSRHLTSYPSAAETKLVSTIAERPKLLQGLSILAVGSKGVVDEKLKAFAFLAWVAAPERFCLLATFEDARKQLLTDEAQGVTWDLVFCDAERKAVEAAIFSNSRKRKPKSTAAAAHGESLPRKVRVVNKEDLLQSFVLGQLIEDQSIA